MGYPNFSKIDEDVTPVSTQLHIQSFCTQFSAVTNVLQPCPIVPENAEIVLIVIAIQDLPLSLSE